MKITDTESAALFQCLANQIAIMAAISEFELSKPVKDMLFEQLHATVEGPLYDEKEFDEDEEDEW